MVSFWPDSIWTPEFTDLATASPSPHRHLDGMAVAAAAAVLTEQRAAGHQPWSTRCAAIPRMLAQTRADHRPPRQGPLHPRPRQRREREHGALRLRLRAAGQPLRGGAGGDPAAVGQRRPGRLRRPVLSRCTMPAWTPSRTRAGCRRSGSAPAVRGCSTSPAATPTGGGRRARGLRSTTPQMLAAVRTSAERAGRDPMAITPCFIQVCLIGRGRRGARRDPAGAAGQGVPAAGLGRDAARASALSTRWGRTGAASRTSTRPC